MKKVLITGVSSGIGRELVKDLNKKGYLVVGVARRKELLESLKKELTKPDNFTFIQADLQNKNAWIEIIKNLNRKKFIPDIVIFNAAVWEKKLVTDFKFDSLQTMNQVNFLSILEGVYLLLNYKKVHFITISTLSALWGSPVEGVGYPASKAALTIAFEGLYQNYKNSDLVFTTVSFGPIKAQSNSFLLLKPFQISLKDTVRIIEKAIIEKKPAYFAPSLLFFCFNLIRLLPTNLRLRVFNLVDQLHPYHLGKLK